MYLKLPKNYIYSTHVLYLRDIYYSVVSKYESFYLKKKYILIQFFTLFTSDKYFPEFL